MRARASLSHRISNVGGIRDKMQDLGREGWEVDLSEESRCAVLSA